MHIHEAIVPYTSVGNTWVGTDSHGNPIYTPFTTTSGGLTKLEHFMLEITKAVTISEGGHGSPTYIVNRAQEIFELLKKRIEDITAKGLLSDHVPTTGSPHQEVAAG